MMNKTKSHPRMSRRDFLKLLAVSGVTVTGGYLLSEYAPWLDYNQQADQTWKPFEMPSTSSAQMRQLVHCATLAANGHNTQPWKFAIKDNAIEIHPDYGRELSVVDPDHRELWISLGCALENLMIAARATGFSSEVSYPDKADFIGVKLTADTRQNSPLFEAIPMRQNTRSEYDGQPIPDANMDQIQTISLEPGVTLRFATTQPDLETMLECVNQGNLIQYTVKAFIDELIYWLRFFKKEAMTSLDGLFSLCSGNPEIPRLVGKMFVAGAKPQQQADADAKKLRSSSAAVVIASEADNRSSWVRTGQVYERMALQMTTLNIKSAFLNQPIETSKIRSQFQSVMGLGKTLPQLLIRFGYTDAMPRSLRRPIEEVLIQNI
jgi:hypothetical protein